MNNKGTIGLVATLSVLGAGLLWAFGLKKEDSHEDQKSEKQYGDEIEDHFVSLSNQRIKAALTPLNQRKKANYQADLKRYGTRQGVLDVADATTQQKKKKKQLKGFVKTGQRLTKTAQAKVITPKHRQSPTNYKAFYKWLVKEFSKTQLTITNTSSQEREVSLWGMNKGSSISPPIPQDVEDHEFVNKVDYASIDQAAHHPQGIAFNPANGLVYVANQLSNNVSVITSEGQLIALVSLEPSLLPGFNSPVAVAINTNEESEHYGKAYVAGSVANTISVIDLSYQVTTILEVGVRPINLVYNPVNDQLYVANLLTNTVTVIDATTESVSTTLQVGKQPLGLGVNSHNGEFYIANSGDGSVIVFDPSHTMLTTVSGVGTRPVSITYHPVNKEMYVVCSQSNAIYPIDATSHTLLAPLATGNSPYTSVFNSSNNYLYVGNREDDTFTIIAADKSIRATISKGPVNIGFTFNPNNQQLLITDTLNNQIHLMGYSEQSTSVLLSEDYAHKAQNFHYNPAIVAHTKWVLSGEERFAVLHFVEETPTGTKTTTPISHENYKSPQNFLNVSELTELEGSVIDGKTSWLFKIAGHQTITVLVYFRQVEFYKTLGTAVDQTEHPKQNLKQKI